MQRQCLKYVKDQAIKGHPILAINQHGNAFSSRGVPDIILCIKGKFIGVELKVGDNKPTPLQVNYLNRIASAGGQSHVCYTVAEFKEVIDVALH